MKTTRLSLIRVLVGLAALACSERTLCQGFVYGNTGVNGAAIAAIYGPDPADPNRQQWGNTPEGRPPGTQAYAGDPLFGSGYSVEAWYSLTPVTDAFQLVGDAKPVALSLGAFTLAPGYFPGGELTIPEFNTTQCRIYLFRLPAGARMGQCRRSTWQLGRGVERSAGRQRPGGGLVPGIPPRTDLRAPAASGNGEFRELQHFHRAGAGHDGPDCGWWYRLILGRQSPEAAVAGKMLLRATPLMVAARLTQMKHGRINFIGAEFSLPSRP